MNIDWESVKYLVVLPAGILIKLVWNHEKSLQKIREEIAADYPTWSEMKREIKTCSDQKDAIIKDQNDRVEKSLKYITEQVDKIRDKT